MGGEIGEQDFQRLLLLLCGEEGATAPYEFVPGRCGGVSFTALADRRRLIEQNLLEDAAGIWKLTATGRTAAAKVSGKVRLAMDRLAREQNGRRGEALLHEVNRRHPDFFAAPQRGEPGLCTIGYEGSSLEGYLNRLLRAGVTLLCDVRRNPLSRKYGFSKGTLAKSCDEVGIRYEHLPELGIASEERRELKTQADYDAIFAVYEREHLPKQGAALARIRGWVAEGQRVALTCFEADPCECHRHCVAEALEREFGGCFAPRHL
ncbi:MAG TPA: DUF488 domain-containing protein [Opitutaceae bacterium]|nr:DUF488 domain-containing protein [Opitutaceae bacterium]